MSDSVNHPHHYNALPATCGACGHRIECIDVIEWMSLNIGNAVKYLWRAGVKTPDPVEDIEKAIFYLRREINRWPKMQARELIAANASNTATPLPSVTENAATEAATLQPTSTTPTANGAHSGATQSP